MPHPVRFGYKVSAEQFGPSDLLDFTVAAERCGFDTAGISDHFQPWRHSGGHAPFSLAWLGAAGQATSRIQLGTSVLTPTFRYHPAVVAQAMSTLGCLFPGRVWGVDDPMEMERLADALTTERAAGRWIVSTDPDEHVEALRPYLDLGFTQLIFHAPGTDQRRFLDLYSRDVLPRLRRITA